MANLNKSSNKATNSGFSFRKFTVRHDRCAMKVGTDGVLLGAWVDVGNARNILDVGTGTGLIALMTAQRSGAGIDAMEIDKEAFIQAGENARNSPWPERIQIFHASFQHFAKNCNHHYDVIVANPPYFYNALRPSGMKRSVARHNERLDYEGLFFYSSMIISQNGRLSVIVPYEQMGNVLKTAWLNDFFAIRLLKVRMVANKDFSRCLLEFGRNRNSACIESELCLIDKLTGCYSEEYLRLTSEYYL